MSILLDEAIEKAKVKMMLTKDSAFLASVMLSMNIEADEKQETAKLEGLDLRINPEWFLGLPEAQQKATLTHQAWHVALEHEFRAMPFIDNMDKFNKAADHEVNTMLYDAGFELPPNAPCDMQYKGMPAEAIYKLLEDEDGGDDDQDDNNGDGGGSGDSDGDGDGRSNDQMQNDLSSPPDKNSTNEKQQQFAEAQDKITDTLAKAAMAAEMAGQGDSVPQSVQRMLDNIRNPKLPWNTILENYLNDRTKDDYSWSKRNRRYQDIYLPSLDSEGMGEIRMYGDQSGSFGDREFSVSVRELQYIQEIMNPSKMVYRAFTTQLTEEEVFTREEVFAPVARVCGGTDITPVIQDIRESSAEIAVIFTDGYFYNVDMENLGTDIIWVIVGNESWTCPKGFKTIHMEIPHD